MNDLCRAKTAWQEWTDKK